MMNNRSMLLMKSILIVFAIFVFSEASTAQSTHVLPGTWTDDIANRWEILYDFDDEIYGTQRNTSRKGISYMARQLRDRALSDTSVLSKLDLQDVEYIIDDNIEFNREVSESVGIDYSSKKIYDSTGVFYYTEGGEELANQMEFKKKKPILKYFYKSNANFFEVKDDNFDLVVNPILNLRYGNTIDDPNLIFQNTRGIELRGLIDDNIYFYTNLLENQRGFNNYINERIDRDKTIPGQGFFKNFDSAVIESLQGFDYLNAQAYVGINATKSVAIEFGHGSHFIGNGVRSLFLSNYAHNYFYLKFNTRIWKFHFQNIFAELAPVASRQNPGNTLLPKKYMANHYLSFRPTKNIEFGLFEAVVFSRENHFEFQYLNPVILYRTVEQFLDSPDNALIGLNGKWNIKNRVQLYGQMILDEFKLNELTSGNGWWANKYGFQAGGKYINAFGVDHLDLQVEYNVVRPYTYSHSRTLESFPAQSTASYSHHNQPLAHPLGSNFKELLINLKYRPTKRIFVNTRIFSTEYGQNPEGINAGGDILLISGSRESDFGNSIGQGINTRIQSVSIDVSYQFAHNYFFDLNLLYRNANADIDELDIETKYVGGGLRVNIGQVKLDY